MSRLHYHWRVIAGKDINGELTDQVYVEVVADTEEEAISLTKEVVSRPHYQLAGVRECRVPDIGEEWDD